MGFPNAALSNSLPCAIDRFWAIHIAAVSDHSFISTFSWDSSESSVIFLLIRAAPWLCKFDKVSTKGSVFECTDSFSFFSCNPLTYPRNSSRCFSGAVRMLAIRTAKNKTNTNTKPGTAPSQITTGPPTKTSTIQNSQPPRAALVSSQPRAKELCWRNPESPIPTFCPHSCIASSAFARLS